MPYDSVRKFEETIADYCGSKYAVSVSSCTNAIFLSLLYSKITENFHGIYIPKQTYIGVATSIKNAGMEVWFNDFRWYGWYILFPTNVVDSALCFKKDMHTKGFMECLSFHNRKHIPIGRGGMILLDDPDAYKWLKKARYDGREECGLKDQKEFNICGYNMYMTPEQASRGLVLFNNIKDKHLPALDDYDTYPDLSRMEIFK